VNDIAPRYGLKILGLLGYDILNKDEPADADLQVGRINDPPDQLNGTNPTSRAYAFRTRDIIAHYGDRVAAWEMFNEVNYWAGVTLVPERMAGLMVYTFGLGKTANPNAKIIVGAQIDPNDVAPFSPADYLKLLFNSQPVQNYINTPRPAPFDKNPFPWDGIAWHPYYYNVDDAIKSMERLVEQLRAIGDFGTKIWITEFGMPANMRDRSGCGLGQEQPQAQYLLNFYRQMVLKHINEIEAVFWFKYEDFYDDTGKIQPYGLVQLERNGNRYAPSGRVTHYKAAYYAYQSIAGPELPVDRVPPPPVQRSAASPDAPVYFGETGHTLSGPFLRYWEQNGGLALFGFPLTEPFEELNPADGKRYLVQYFERERFEYHPENKPPYDVLLGLLGSDMTRLDCKIWSPLPAPPPGTLPSFRTYFPETGHYLSFEFKDYWERRGGLAIFGFPISEEITEVSPTDGKEYKVQYFERARFEFHPEAPPEYQVLLALLGSEYLKRRGWLQ
jgi:hypothetical protein